MEGGKGRYLNLLLEKENRSKKRGDKYVLGGCCGWCRRRNIGHLRKGRSM
jgi:hypothetical protein